MTLVTKGVCFTYLFVEVFGQLGEDVDWIEEVVGIDLFSDGAAASIIVVIVGLCALCGCSLGTKEQYSY